MESERLIIFFDTNILYVSGDKGEDFSEFSLNNVYNDLTDFIERNDFEGVKIFIPKIVLEELSFQKRKRYPESLKTLKNHFKDFDKLPGFIFQAPDDFDYDPYLYQRIEEYTARMGIDILPYPSNERFNYLIKRAVEKRPPFKGKDTISDKGFKDAINWESILEFARSHECENYLLYSKDQDFSEELEIEFNAITSKRIKVIREKRGMQQYLSDFFGVNLGLKKVEDILEKSDFIADYRLDIIEKYKYIDLGEKFAIKEIDFVKDKPIEDISEIDIDYFELTIPLQVIFEKEEPQTKQRITDKREVKMILKVKLEKNRLKIEKASSDIPLLESQDTLIEHDQNDYQR